MLQYMRDPTETLSCPGTKLGPQRAAQDSPGHSRAGQSFQVRVWSWAVEMGEEGNLEGGREEITAPL